MDLKRVTLVVHEGKATARQLEKDLTRWFSERSIEVGLDRPDLVVSLGGDGTALRAAREAHAADVPLLTVNMGTLGYLTEVDPGRETDALERIVSGAFEIERRTMLLGETDGPSGPVSFVGLNEVLVERSSRRRLVKLDVRIGGERLATFNCDGVIVATPTGSTAYALSAGGPIVSPRADCLILVPVSPHMIFSRPVVLSADDTVQITVGDGNPEEPVLEASVVLDGALGCDIASGTTVRVQRHERPLQLIRLSGPRFLERLRAKLDLPS